MTFDKFQIDSMYTDENDLDSWIVVNDSFEVPVITDKLKEMVYHFFGFSDEQWDDFDGWLECYALGKFSECKVDKLRFCLVSGIVCEVAQCDKQLTIDVDSTEGIHMYFRLRKSEKFEKFARKREG